MADIHILGAHNPMQRGRQAKCEMYLILIEIDR